jgi:hypothetical protein
VEWKLRYHDPDLVLVLLAAGAEWQPESPESCQSMVQRMSEGVWQEDDLVRKCPYGMTADRALQASTHHGTNT